MPGVPLAPWDPPPGTSQHHGAVGAPWHPGTPWHPRTAPALHGCRTPQHPGAMGRVSGAGQGDTHLILAQPQLLFWGCLTLQSSTVRRGLSPTPPHPDSTRGSLCTQLRGREGGLGAYVVAGGVGLHGVLGGQGDAAHGDDHQDAHLKVPQVDNVVAQPAEPGGGWNRDGEGRVSNWHPQDLPSPPAVLTGWWWRG